MEQGLHWFLKISVLLCRLLLGQHSVGSEHHRLIALEVEIVEVSLRRHRFATELIKKLLDLDHRLTWLGDGFLSARSI